MLGDACKSETAAVGEVSQAGGGMLAAGVRQKDRSEVKVRQVQSYGGEIDKAEAAEAAAVCKAVGWSGGGAHRWVCQRARGWACVTVSR